MERYPEYFEWGKLTAWVRDQKVWKEKFDDWPCLYQKQLLVTAKLKAVLWDLVPKFLNPARLFFYYRDRDREQRNETEMLKAEAESLRPDAENWRRFLESRKKNGLAPKSPRVHTATRTQSRKAPESDNDDWDD